jgi:RimJ/RimL family protein N-acetyltransferase
MNTNVQHSTFKIRKMTPSDFSSYENWYRGKAEESKRVARFYEGPTEAWRDYVTSSPDANAYAALDSQGVMVAHIQCDNWAPNDVTVSIVVNPDMWGSGTATSVLRQFIHQILKEKDKIIAHIDHGNIASLRVFEKLGFTKAAEQRADPSLVTYELLLPVKVS